MPAWPADAEPGRRALAQAQGGGQAGHRRTITADEAQEYLHSRLTQLVGHMGENKGTWFGRTYGMGRNPTEDRVGHVTRRDVKCL